MQDGDPTRSDVEKRLNGWRIGAVEGFRDKSRTELLWLNSDVLPSSRPHYAACLDVAEHTGDLERAHGDDLGDIIRSHAGLATHGGGGENQLGPFLIWREVRERHA